MPHFSITTLVSVRLAKISAFRYSLRIVPLKLLLLPFCQGFPGSILASCICGRFISSRSAWGYSESRRHVVSLAIKDLRKAGAKLAGTLLTMVNVKMHATYSYGDSGAYTGDLKEYYIG